MFANNLKYFILKKMKSIYRYSTIADTRCCFRFSRKDIDRFGEDVQVSFPEEVYDLVGLVNSAHKEYQKKFPYLISRLDLYRFFPFLLKDKDIHSADLDGASKVFNENNLTQLVRNRTSWLDINDRTETEALKEKVKYVKDVLLRSVDFLKVELEFSLPRGVASEIDRISSMQNLLDFIFKAQGLKTSPYGPVICGLLKVADVFIEMDNQSSELEDLRGRTTELENDLKALLSAQGEEYKAMDFTNPVTQTGAIQMTGSEAGSFRAREIHFNAKSEHSTASKMLRKVRALASTVVSDGVQMRVILPDDESADNREARIQQFFESFPGYYFQLDDGNANSAKDPNRKEIKFDGFKLEPAEVIDDLDSIDPSRFNIEVQLVTEKAYFRNESGIRNHTVYRAVQNFQVLARLFGSIGKVRFEKKLDQLAAQEFKDTNGNPYHLNRETLEDLFSKHFYLNNQTNRYHWFEYDFRTNGIGIFSEEDQEKRNEGTIDAIVNLAHEYKPMNHCDLADTSPAEWKTIIETNNFPDNAKWRSVHYQTHATRFLDTIPGIPGFIKACLEIQVKATQRLYFRMPKSVKNVELRTWRYLFREKSFPSWCSKSERRNITAYLADFEGEIFKGLSNPFQYFLPMITEETSGQVGKALEG